MCNNIRFAGLIFISIGKTIGKPIVSYSAFLISI